MASKTCWRARRGSSPAPEALRSGRFQSVVFLAQRDRRLEEAFLAAAVVADSVVAVAQHAALFQQTGDGVRELDFAADPGLGAAQVIEDFGFQDVPAHDRLVRGRV